MRILLTGANGFVGSRVWPVLLARGHEVVAAGRRIPAEAATGLRWIEADLLGPGEAERVAREARADVLVHLAWTVEHGKFWTDPANLDWVAASLHLFRGVAANGGKRIVAAGTCFEYDWPGDGDCREVVTPLAAHTLYDVAKSSLRALVETWAAQEKIAFAWGRIFYLYGAGEHPARLVADVARHVVAGLPAECSSGRVLRDFMDVRDAGAAFAALALADASGPVNVGSGEAVSIADIARMIGKIAGRPDLVRLGARPDRPDEPPRITADIGRLRSLTGFRPSIDMRAGLADAVDWWRGRMDRAT